MKLHRDACAVAVPLAEPDVPKGEPAVQVAVAVFVTTELGFEV